MEERKLTKEQAIDILIQSVQLGCQRGAYVNAVNELIQMCEIGRQNGAFTFPELGLINLSLVTLNEKHDA